MPSNSSPKATATTSSRTSSANPCPRTSSPAASACSPHRTLRHRLFSVPSSRLIPLRIHAYFDRLMALTPSHAGPFPRFHGFALPPRAPAWSIAAWEPSRAFPSFIPDHTHPCALSQHARTTLSSVSSARFPFELSAFFAFARRPLLARPPPLRLRRGALAMERAQIALLLVGYGRYLSARVHLVRLAHLMHLVRLLTEVDGDGDGMMMQMEMSGRASMGMGRSYACVYIPPHPQSYSAVWRGRTYGRSGDILPPALVPPSFGFALARPALALALALLPHPHPRLPSLPLCAMEMRGCGYGCSASTSPPSPSASASPPRARPAQYAYGGRVRMCVWRDHTLVVALARVIVRSRAARSANLGILLGLDAHSRVDGGGDADIARVRVHTARPLPCSLSAFLAIFLFKLGRIPFLHDLMCTQPPIPFHIRTAIALNKMSN
ncbi:hypothetical protein B0H13DRAFT_2551908 [Mycena leptocephala]|nr:hypothetical protein B0H13DRAFT_2551908 [Mycena leptocephala]